MFPCLYLVIILVGIANNNEIIAEINHDSHDIIILDKNTAAEIARNQAESTLAAQSALAATQFSGKADLAFTRPQISAKSSYRHNFALSTFRLGPLGEVDAGRVDDHAGTLMLDQLLWNFGKSRAIAEQSSAATELSRAMMAEIRRDNAFHARMTVITLLLERARLAIISDRIKQRQGEQQDAQALFDAGLVSELDVRQAEINRLQVEIDRKQTESNIEQLQQDLSFMIALKPRSFKIVGELSRSSDLMVLFDNATQHIESGPELARLQAKSRILNGEKLRLAADNKPELHAVGEAGVTGPAVNNLDDEWAAGLILSWKLYQGGKIKSQRSSVTLQLQEIAWLTQEVIRDRYRQLAKFENIIDTIKDKIRHEERAVELAAANYLDAREQYRAGIITLSRLGEVNLSVAEARFRLVGLLYEEQSVENNLLRLIE